MYDYVDNNLPIGNRNIYFQNIRSIDEISDADHLEIYRKKGGLVDPIKDDLKKKENTLHYFAIFTNRNNQARLFYKTTAKISLYKREKK